MIVKSYLAEQEKFLLDKKLLLFYGQNLGLKDDFKSKIRKTFNKSSIQNLTQDDVLKDRENFFSNLFNISLFNDQKIFIINDCTDKILELIVEIENKIQTQKIFLFSEQLEKKSKLRSLFEKSKENYCIACYIDDERNIKKIIQEQLKDYEGLSTEVINIIMDNCALDRSKLNNEIQKIRNFFIEKKIDRKKIEEILNIKVSESFDLVKDAVLSGDKVKTNKLLSDAIIETEKIIFYLAVINQRLNKLFQAKILTKDKTIEEVMNNFRPPIFWKDKPFFLKQFKKWKVDQIKSALNITYDHEVMIKSNYAVNKDILFKKFLVDICNLPNS